MSPRGVVTGLVPGPASTHDRQRRARRRQRPTQGVQTRRGTDRRPPGRQSADPARRLPRPDGPIRVGQDDVVESDRRTRPADWRYGRRRGGPDRSDVGRQAGPLARTAYRIRLPAVQPPAGADRRKERRAAAAPDVAVTQGSAAPCGDRDVGCRARGSGEALSASAFRRPGAACRHRARDRHRPDTASVRRADG